MASLMFVVNKNRQRNVASRWGLYRLYRCGVLGPLPRDQDTSEVAEPRRVSFAKRLSLF
jgi:hypothetical protein